MAASDAYLDWDRWIADCPGCLDAVAVYPDGPGTDPQLSQSCSLGHPIDVTMPADQAGLETEMGRRTHEADRWWYPADHPRAVAQGLPHGLTATELADQTDALNARWLP